MTSWWLSPGGHAVGEMVSGDARAFHTKLTGYEPTLLRDCPALAKGLGLGELWVKDESSRLGLQSFKVLGASWGIYRALEKHLGGFTEWASIEELAVQLEPALPFALAAATDGNHGRAVASMARRLGLEARIFVPQGTATARIEAITGEGASCDIVDGSYDDAVARSAREAGERCLVISDTSWPGYADVPRWVIEGYETIFSEVADEMGDDAVDLVLVQAGVGALAAAAARHYGAARGMGAALVGVEPTSAACILASLEAGRIVSVPGPHNSIMAGLNCGAPSIVAWPYVAGGFRAFMAISDDAARGAMRDLAVQGIAAGETGAAGLAGLTQLMTAGETRPLREALGVDAATRALVLCTEGPTDPEAYARIVQGVKGTP